MRFSTEFLGMYSSLSVSICVNLWLNSLDSIRFEFPNERQLDDAWLSFNFIPMSRFQVPPLKT